MGTPWNTTLTTQVSRSAPTAAPDWFDISAWVRPDTSATIGRQSVLPGTEPGRLSLALTNNDRQWTVGNTSSPYYSWWRPGKRIRQYETLANAAVCPIFDGYIAPEGINEDIELDTTDGTSVKVAVVRVAAIDVLGRAQSGRTFVSTLGAHIMGCPAAANLLAYLPMNDHGPSFADVLGRIGPLAFEASPFFYGAAADAVLASIEYGGAESIPGDDINPAHWTPAYNPADGSIYGGHNAQWYGDATNFIDVQGGETIALVAWVRSATLGTGQAASNQPLLRDDAGDTFMYFTDDPNQTAGTGTVTTAATGGTASLAKAFPHDTWRLRTLRVDMDTGAMDLWVGSDQVASATTSPDPPGALQFTQLKAGYELFGSVAHLQVYVGAGAFNYDDHLAQWRVGMAGLEGQYTGERVRAIAAYAGIPTSLLDIDPGTVPMSKARLAGSRAFDAFERARETEQGRLLCTPAGLLTFHDRRRIYNI